MEVEEVDDVAVRQAVHKVPGDPAAHEPEAGLGVRGAQPECLSPDEDGDEGCRGEGRQEEASPGEDAPRGAGVAHVDDVEETGDNHDGARAGAVGVEGQACGDPGL
jgi:hypothetical protein